MKIGHRVSLNSSIDKDKNLIQKLDSLNIQYKKVPFPGANTFMVFFDIYETDKAWDVVKKEAAIPDNSGETTFSEKEILEAEWLRLMPAYDQGYPQPEEEWQENHPNYKNYCSECGTFTQVGSFRIKSEPKMGKYDFMSLTWTYDLFSTQKVFELFDANNVTGYEKWPVIIDKTDKPSTTISQIYVNHIAKPGLKEPTLGKSDCKSCGIVKYFYHRRGPMHIDKNSLDPKLDLQLSGEWFSPARDARREIFVSNKVAKLIIENKLKGVRFKVIETV